MKTVILFFATTDYKIQLFCGRALKTRPYNYKNSIRCVVTPLQKPLHRL